MSSAKNLIWLIAISFAVLVTVPVPAQSNELTGTEIKLGTIISSDEAATRPEATIARIIEAYVKKTNDEGGINGRMIRIFSYDDGGDSRRTLDLVRKLVEVDHVAFLFNIGNRASDVIAPYIRFKKIPQLFSLEFGEQTPPQKQTEILGNYILRNLPKAKIAILKQADAVGAQFLRGFYAGLTMEQSRFAITNMDEFDGAGRDGNRVAGVSGSSSDILAIFGGAESELELLREMAKLKWRPLLVMNDAVLTLELNQVNTSAEIISLWNHPRTDLWTVAELAEWDAFRKTYLSDHELDSSAARYSYALARSMVTLLQRVGDELTPERLVGAYNRIRHETLGLMSKPVIDLVRFNGKTWDVIENDVQHFQDNTPN
jgi:ABC-type branched-subunit amino acid transport system substrate-binding protein